MAEPFTEQQKRDILKLAKDSGLKNTDIIQKMLYGGSITANGNTVNFDGKNSHALKLHLAAPGFKPQRGAITFEEIQKYLPEALKQKPKIEVHKGKRGRKTISKIYTVKNNNIVYTLVTREKGDFKSFYSNKKATNDVTDTNMSSASSKSLYDTLPQNWENASENQKKLRFSLKNGENAPQEFATNTNLERRLIEKIWSHGR